MQVAGFIKRHFLSFGQYSLGRHANIRGYYPATAIRRRTKGHAVLRGQEGDCLGGPYTWLIDAAALWIYPRRDIQSEDIFTSL